MFRRVAAGCKENMLYSISCLCAACRLRCGQWLAAPRSQLTSPAAAPGPSAARFPQTTPCCTQSQQQASQACMQSPQLRRLLPGPRTGQALNSSPAAPAYAAGWATAAGQQPCMVRCMARPAAACQQKQAGCLLWVLQRSSLRTPLGALQHCLQHGAWCWSGR